MRSIILISMLSFGVVGCVATPDLKTDPGTALEDRVLAQRIAEHAQRVCITYRYEMPTGLKLSGDVKLHKQPVVKRLYRSPTGWVKAELQMDSIWDNAYYHESRNLFICGEKLWQEQGIASQVAFFEIGRGASAVATVGLPQISPRPVVEQRSPSVQATPSQPASQSRTQVTTSKEGLPIALRWEGFTGLILGTVELDPSRDKGLLKAVLPRGDGLCSGTYEMASQQKGLWAISCTNGLSATGTLEAFGVGRGASGSGIDAKGNRVELSFGTPQ